MTLELPQLATSRYQNGVAIIESGLVPVRITAGYPRFLKLAYELKATVMALAPDGETIKMKDRDAFAEMYLEKVRKHAPIASGLLRDISERNGGRGLVLLCYEDLTKAGEWCHRRILADFLQEMTGDEIPELGLGQPATQPTLC